MLGLVLVSGICGLLLGRYYKMYVCLPTTVLLIPAAYFVGQTDSFTNGILAFVFSAIALQVCYAFGAAVRIFIENFGPQKAPSEDFI
ncbi:hypothetical protein UP10_00815 [Bradyrhizobium sp. LTSPM299]|uniref:hypothetical protein n=1 Tax=Bradyrhizobium sp. LTSPM299 TaxID=1619233 RepID=UPI0005C88FB4|nr:hypothetical protein [Bradyrhizobium sp. LTSPM299]KJC62752.1 hypothetical protein UP10_00815 [Bradyrhizobium sp. LTSPM299]